MANSETAGTRITEDGRRTAGCGLRETVFRKPSRVFGNYEDFDTFVAGVGKMAWFIAAFVSGRTGDMAKSGTLIPKE